MFHITNVPFRWLPEKQANKHLLVILWNVSQQRQRRQSPPPSQSCVIMLGWHTLHAAFSWFQRFIYHCFIAWLQSQLRSSSEKSSGWRYYSQYTRANSILFSFLSTADVEKIFAYRISIDWLCSFMITKLIRHTKVPRSINVDVLRCLNVVSHGNKWKHAWTVNAYRLEKKAAASQ